MSDSLHKEMMQKPLLDYGVKRNLNEIEYVIDLVQRLRENRYRKALVVDDAKSARLLLASLLERHYFKVFTAEDGQQALQILKQQENIQRFAVAVFTQSNAVSGPAKPRPSGHCVLRVIKGF